MRLENGVLVYAASDLVNFLACQHLSELEFGVASGTLDLEASQDDGAALVARKGDEHEKAYLEDLRTSARTLVEIPHVRHGGATLVEAAELTTEAMRAGADTIFQATFFDGHWRGHTDFLERVERPSELGDYSYEVLDTKLAKRTKAYFLIQLCVYSEMLAAAQGLAPEQMHVVLGSRVRESFRVADFSAYYRRVKARFVDRVENGFGDTYPEPVAHCGVCRWNERCHQRRVDDDHLSLVANIARSQRTRLVAQAIETVAELAVATAEQRPSRIGAPTYERLRQQARLQVEQRESGEPVYELLPPEEGRGFARLPEPDEGDLYFDMEGDPFFEDGLEYLFGVCYREDGEVRFKAFWALNRTEEKRAFEDFIDFAIDRLDRFPGAHIYHYASYEETAIKHLMGLHATREAEVDRLLRGKLLVDLFRVVQQGLRLGSPSYSIKEVEAFYMGPRVDEVTAAGDSIVEFERFLEEDDRAILDAIERYNQTDCESTELLHRWLLERRGEAAGQYDDAIEWFVSPPGDAPENEDQDAIDALRASLLASIPDDPVERDPEQHARWLTAQLVDYHRREAKPAWWEYFNRLDMSDEELIDDRDALGGLVPTGRRETLAPPRRSELIELSFEPQEHKISAGGWIDPATERGVTVDRLDEAAGVLWISRGTTKWADPPPTALVPGGPITTKQQQAALREFAGQVADGQLDGDGPFRAARGILTRELPRCSEVKDGAPLETGGHTLDRTIDIALGLQSSHLFVQGPPGSGKTYTGAKLILALIAAGKSVGVTAQSHKAIHNLLAEVEEFCEAGEITGLQKCGDGADSAFVSTHDPPTIRAASDNGSFPADVSLMAGTAWLWCRPEMRNSVDVLVIDEAGQISLADALALSTAADSVILLGDPMQLAQVSQGIHPPGVGASVLEHLLGEHSTVPAERGVFLDETRRMHPDVCEFVSDAIYEGRLASEADCARQSLATPGLTGTGMRRFLLNHEGNSRSSAEEADLIDFEIRRMLDGGTWVDRDGVEHPLTPKDIMVVSPYNAQVRCVLGKVPDGVRVGTVDKFQGRQATVVFFSTATSSGQEIPRNLEFLFSRNRLNVAVSRARCVAVLVCSEELLHIQCRSAEQMRLVNALCLLEEQASDVRSTADVSNAR